MYKDTKYHFIGAGGIGMSGLAKLMMENGAVITGSDMEDSHVVAELRSLGADIRIGHSSENVSRKLDAAVISAAIKPLNPELRAIQEKGVKVYKYSEMLGQVMERYTSIAVCGTHGKSTTSGWISRVLEQAGEDPNFIVGADIPQLGGSSRTGKLGGLFVAEACEYDRSFLNLHPEIGIILNIEQDHLDYYKDEDDIVRAFSDFVENIKPGGTVIINGEDLNCRKAFKRSDKEIDILTYGLDENCDLYANNIELKDGFYEFDIYFRNGLLGRTRISLPGKHNIYNALAVAAGCLSVGIDTEKVLGLLGEFTGIDRRLMVKDNIGGILVMDDYAHHPTEIKASLQAIKQRYNPIRLWCVFQPHQYSRTRFLLDDFAKSFTLADITIVPEIYFVRDTKESKKQVNAQVLVEKICSSGSEAIFINDFSSICEYLKKNVGPGELVVTMGAGTVWKVADEYIQWLRKNC